MTKKATPETSIPGHYTPGPWKISGKYGRCSDEITGPSGDAVAIVFTRKADPATVTGILPHPEGMGNARLIEAAPALLTAARAFIDQIWGTWEVPSDAAADALNALLLAVAQAEGRA